MYTIEWCQCVGMNVFLGGRGVCMFDWSCCIVYL